MGTLGTPTLEQFKAWLGLEASDDIDDVVLTDSLNAALAAQAMTVAYPLAEVDEPDAAVCVREGCGHPDTEHLDGVGACSQLDGCLAFEAATPEDNQTFTDDLTTAIWLRAQRLAARRNSPEGVVGISSGTGDFTGARLPATDVDVARLEAPWTVIGVA
jgi:hypothetical protein